MDKDKLDYFFLTLDGHLAKGIPAEDALNATVESYKYVYFEDDQRTPIARAAELELKKEGFIEYPFSVATLNRKGVFEPIGGVHVRIFDSWEGKGYPKFEGYTDANGWAKDRDGRSPFLQPGTWYFFANKPGYTFHIPPQVVRKEK